MAFNRDEHIALLGALLRKDHPKFAEIVEQSQNISKDRKIRLLMTHIETVYDIDPGAADRLLKLLEVPDSSA